MPRRESEDWDISFDLKCDIKAALFAEMGKSGRARITPIPLSDDPARKRSEMSAIEHLGLVDSANWRQNRENMYQVWVRWCNEHGEDNRRRGVPANCPVSSAARQLLRSSLLVISSATVVTAAPLLVAGLPILIIEELQGPVQNPAPLHDSAFP
ncbi:unnamed protein product [Oikopleura dioica]|uniref:Uncharacterized protein n=1 Tax=Oikopleura dioica TaxID=34765 RepID=E4XCK9_OIKDI|nr:unnamed protein product [Oikopleura dioica]